MKQAGSRVQCVKTFRLDQELVEDMLKCVRLAGKEGKPKFRSMTAFLVAALGDRIKLERRILEDQGVVWDHVNQSHLVKE